MKTTGNKVVVERVDNALTKSGIIIPDSVENPKAKYVIAEVGPEVKSAAVGSSVVINPVRLPFFLYEITGKKYYVISEYDIELILAEDEEVSYLVAKQQEEA